VLLGLHKPQQQQSALLQDLRLPVLHLLDLAQLDHKAVWQQRLFLLAAALAEEFKTPT
jgi:hypothetical protein